MVLPELQGIGAAPARRGEAGLGGGGAGGGPGERGVGGGGRPTAQGVWRRGAACRDRGLAADKQHPQRLALAAAAQLGQRLARQRCSRRAQSVEGVALGATAAAAAHGPLELEHPLTLPLQITGETGSVGAGTL